MNDFFVWPSLPFNSILSGTTSRKKISQHPENGQPPTSWSLYVEEFQGLNSHHQLIMNLYCTDSRTDLLGSNTSSSNLYILEFPARAKASCYRYSAKLQLLKWLGYQCHSHVLVQTEPKCHPGHKLGPESWASLHAMQQLQLIPHAWSAAVHV